MSLMGSGCRNAQSTLVIMMLPFQIAPVGLFPILVENYAEDERSLFNNHNDSLN
jgi:hypothetical protein